MPENRRIRPDCGGSKLPVDDMTNITAKVENDHGRVRLVKKPPPSFLTFYKYSLSLTHGLKQAHTGSNRNVQTADRTRHRNGDQNIAQIPS